MAKPKLELDIDTLRSLISYNPDTGQFTWLARKSPEQRRWNTRYAGKQAGCIKSHGYMLICFMDRRFLAHRVAWAITYGRWPADQIDHVDGDKLNNRISNLREATHHENHQNVTQRANNSSGYLGVGLYKPTMKWKAQIRINGKTQFLGYFDCKDEAYAAYLKAKARLHTFQPVPRS